MMLHLCPVGAGGDMQGKQNLMTFRTLFETLDTKPPKDILTRIQEPHPGPRSKIAL